VNLIADIERKKRVPPPVPTPEELVGMFFKWVDLPHTRGFATLPYIKGLTEPLTRLLRRHDVLVTNKNSQPLNSVRKRKTNALLSTKFPAAHVRGGRSFNTRKKEHTRNVKMHTKGSNVANHAWSKNHQIDFDNALIIDKANYRHLKTLESWHTAKTVYADNNDQLLMPASQSVSHSFKQTLAFTLLAFVLYNLSHLLFLYFLNVHFT